MALDDNLLIGFVFGRYFKAGVADIVFIGESKIEAVDFGGEVEFDFRGVVVEKD